MAFWFIVPKDKTKTHRDQMDNLSPTGVLSEAEHALFILAALADLSDDRILIDDGGRLEVFETGIQISRASDLAKFVGMA